MFHYPSSTGHRGTMRVSLHIHVHIGDGSMVKPGKRGIYVGYTDEQLRAHHKKLEQRRDTAQEKATFYCSWQLTRFGIEYHPNFDRDKAKYYLRRVDKIGSEMASIRLVLKIRHDPMKKHLHLLVPAFRGLFGSKP